MVKYIYAGFSKCGTKSLATAFREMGFKVHDMEETLEGACEGFYRMTDQNLSTQEKSKILYEMFKDVDYCGDWPCFNYWREILEVFPEAKVIFYQREEDAWFKSFQGTTEIVCRNYCSLRWLSR